MRKNGVGKLNKPQIAMIAVFLAICVLSMASVTVSLAAFTNSLHAQRTIAAYDDIGVRFSSNYLTADGNDMTIYTTNSAYPTTLPITVCNYPQGKILFPNEKDVNYTLTATLVKFDQTENDYVAASAAEAGAHTVTISYGESSTVTLGGGSGQVLTTTISESIAGGSAIADTYSFSFSSSFASEDPNLYVKVEASAPGLPTLKGVLKPELRAAGASNAWSGDFRDDKSVAPKDYDGFNYLVTGVGSGTVTLTWDSGIVEMSAVSLALLPGSPTPTSSGSVKTVVFSVDDTICSFTRSTAAPTYGPGTVLRNLRFLR